MTQVTAMTHLSEEPLSYHKRSDLIGPLRQRTYVTSKLSLNEAPNRINGSCLERT